MSIVIGTANDSGAMIVSDTQGSNGDSVEAMSKAGVVHRADLEPSLVYGVSGSYLAIDVAKMACERMIERTRDMAQETYLLPNSIRQSVRKVLDSVGWEPECHNGRAPWWDFSMLVSDGASMWSLDTNLSLLEVPTGTFHMIGCGLDHARGAELFYEKLTDYDIWIEPIDRMKLYASVACELDVHCGGEIEVHAIDAPEAPIFA